MAHEIDWVVRTYGSWNCSQTLGKQIRLKFYGTYDFNTEHKVKSEHDFYVVGEMMNAFKPK